ncbi:hypothetical protein M2132_001793 [Dysgonomonas sp. PH5-45]|nr:hypothetical protein [Dysgonomonas sp. PH5-45]MDH6388347.1 hypothetical protein [Dysgonomonas sp. PH5-37]
METKIIIIILSIACLSLATINIYLITILKLYDKTEIAQKELIELLKIHIHDMSKRIMSN